MGPADGPKKNTTYTTRIELVGGKYVSISDQTPEGVQEMIDAVAGAISNNKAITIHGNNGKNIINGRHIIYAWAKEEKKTT